MFTLTTTISGSLSFDLDDIEIEIECPRCDFYNPIMLKQARLRDVVICRGCKSNIQLDDNMNAVRASRQRIKLAFSRLNDQLNRTFG